MYDTEDNSNELQVKMTYRISIQNESSDVITQVNRLAEYYDSRYTLSAIGRGDLTENNEIPNKLSTSEYSNSGSSYEGYNQLIINSPVRLQPSNQDTIFVQFDLSREAVLELLNTSADDPNRGLDNVIEILSYSSFESDGTAYAGVDVDSNPGNAKPTDLDSTYEDDTTASPRIMLNVKDARKMTGKVFEDEPLVPGGYDNTDGIMTEQERIGNGEYDGGEVGIGGVDVTLQESTGALTYQTITVSEDGAYTYNVTYVDADGNEYVPEDSNRLTPGTTATVTLTKVDSGTEGSVELTAGDFYIPNYIPGDYTLSYTWGDETYTVQNYKATIYNEPDRQNSPYHWHITDTRQYSDALDDYVTRQSIDAEYNDATYETATKTPTITEMVSTTPTMSIEVENTTETTSTGAWLEYKISNIDFGIIERAKQDISLDKRVSKMTVLLANGNPLVDFTIDEEGNLEGEHANVTYMEPSDTTTPKNGFVRLEMDTELMEGAILQVEYTYTASNNSEVDYATEDYYNYGTDKTNVVTITPSEMVDYLDSEWSFDANSNGGWSAVTTQNGWTPTEGSRADNNIDSEVDGGQVQWVTLTKGTDDFMLKKAAYDETSSKTILYTGNLATALQPGQTNNTTLNVSKTLSSGDINLENEAELVREEKNGGAKILTSIPGNYMVGTGPQVEPDDDIAPTVMITPNTGDNLNYILPIAVVVTAFVIIGVGIVFIKKKVLNK